MRNTIWKGFMHRKIALFVSVLVLAGVCGAQATGSKSPTAKPAVSQTTAPATQATGLPTKDTVESFMNHMFGWDKGTTYNVLEIRPSRSAGVAQVFVSMKGEQGQQNGMFYVMPDGKFAILGGEMMPFGADPFAPARAEITSRANGPTKGPANAAVTIVEFSDLECPACKAAQPTIDRLIADEPDVKFIFQNFPLEKLHPWAFLAASYADCVGRQNPDAFWTFVGSVYRDQEAITALLPSTATSGEDAMKQAVPAITKKLQELVAATPANSNKVAACAAEPMTAERIRKSVQLGTDLEVTGTPTIYINGRRVTNISSTPYETLKGLVEAAKTAK